MTALLFLSTIPVIIQGAGRLYTIDTAFAGGTWEEASAFCDSNYGETLATVITDEDAVSVNQAYRAAFPSDSDRAECWLGLNSREQEGVWRWQDDTDCTKFYARGAATHACVDYWKGAPGASDTNPDNANPPEECAEIRIFNTSKIVVVDKRCSNSDDSLNCAVCNAGTVTPSRSPTKRPTAPPTCSSFWTSCRSSVFSKHCTVGTEINSMKSSCKLLKKKYKCQTCPGSGFIAPGAGIDYHDGYDDNGYMLEILMVICVILLSVNIVMICVSWYRKKASGYKVVSVKDTESDTE